LFIIWLIGICCSTLQAQTDSLKIPIRYSVPSFTRVQLIPLGLISAGALLNIGTIKNHIQDIVPDTHTHIDDYLQYAPIAQLYLYDGMGFKHQNSVFTQTKYLAISHLFSGFLVQVLKSTTQVKRPVGGNTSYPSGHTTNAFVNATVLYHEFKDTDPWLAYGGFAMASATGILRITNRAHWLPDVLTGAGIGILTVNLVYFVKPFNHFQPFKEKRKITWIPLISPGSAGILCRF
jgi:membrane-associated phospholipid phosphatase